MVSPENNKKLVSGDKNYSKEDLELNFFMGRGLKKPEVTGLQK